MMQREHSVVLSEHQSGDSLGEPSSWRPLEASPFPLDALAFDAFPLDALAAVAFPLDVLAIEALPLTTWCLEVGVSWPSSSSSDGSERENRLQRG